ncbi:hypothetical protein [Mycolicibacterium arseniciresistens]|uniref:DUF5642 domain-containing protein n=1 Tax=Mycolicibacterium arseniciresistens TaxID=3062257 RepID=A0ABT8UKA2_9MYCO|nr:hypothetical protein [Mycolicibacterium arseniciresistens]MDO3638228.1 hypothetical protein [Mycolicibacterium arseniciresistens]
MIRRWGALLAAVCALTGCATAVTGTPTWPGARLERALLTAEDFPPGVQFDRIAEETDGTGGPGARSGPPAMLSEPPGCSDGLTRVIAGSGERGPGSAAEYVVAWDGVRIVMTVLTWPLDLDRLAATADRCARFETFFDPASDGIPMTTTRLPAPRAEALVYQQTMTLAGVDNSVYFSFENVGTMAVFGIAFPTANPDIAVKGTLPQTFLDTAGRQAQRAAAQ